MLNLNRMEILIGKSNIEKIKSKVILLIGLGGVGSYALEGLIRSGVENIIIVDKDIVDSTNLNRQLMTLTNNIGKYKTDVCYDRILNINSDCNVTKKCINLTKDNVYELFENKIDYVIDACDSIDVKKELIKICTKNDIKFISSMGMGNKLNPEKIKICDIRKTSYDPLARILRNYVKVNKINKKIMVVCSDEVPINNDSKVIGSVSYVPSVAGLMCASYVINDIIKR